MLSDDYEQEQAELREKLLQLDEEIIQQEEQAENIDRIIGKVRKYLDLDELTPHYSKQYDKGGIRSCARQVKRSKGTAG